MKLLSLEMNGSFILKMVLKFLSPLFFLSAGQSGMFGREEFEQLAPVVDGFSLMTYDYSSGAR